MKSLPFGKKEKKLDDELAAVKRMTVVRFLLCTLLALTRSLSLSQVFFFSFREVKEKWKEIERRGFKYKKEGET